MGANQGSLACGLQQCRGCTQNDDEVTTEIPTVHSYDVDGEDRQMPESMPAKTVKTSVDANNVMLDNESLPPRSPSKSSISTMEPTSDNEAESPMTVQQNDSQNNPEPMMSDGISEPLPYHVLSILQALPGHHGCLQQQEAQTLKDLRSAVLAWEGKEKYIDCLAMTDEHEENLLLRFLRARGFDKDKALKMLQHDVDWRSQIGLASMCKQPAEEILGCDPAKIDRYIPMKHIGYDKQGRPVIAKHLGGKSVIAEMLDTCASLEQVIRYHVWIQESFCRLLTQQSQKLGMKVEQIVVIMDTKGFYLGLFNRRSQEFLQRIAEVDMKHYPERLGLLVVANASPLISMAWRGIGKLLDERTRQKIHFTSSPQAAGKVLLEHIEADMLPKEYGGSAPCLDL